MNGMDNMDDSLAVELVKDGLVAAPPTSRNPAFPGAGPGPRDVFMAHGILADSQKISSEGQPWPPPWA